MTGPVSGEPCLARLDGKLSRGVLVDVTFETEAITMTVFCVDTGVTAKCDYSDVYDIPSDLIKMLPYQAIRCCMFGIVPASDGPQWAPAVVDGIFDRIEETFQDGLYAYIVAKDALEYEPTHTIDNYVHQVILIDAVSLNINGAIVSMRLAKYAPRAEATIGALASKLAVDEASSDDRSDGTEADIDSDWESLVDEKYHRVAPGNNVDSPGRSKQPDDAQEHQLNVDELDNDNPDREAFFEAVMAMAGKTENAEKTVAAEPRDKPPTKSTKIHRLIYMHKRPAICWHQTDDSIGLKIAADEHVEYGLKVGVDFVVYRYCYKIQTLHLAVNAIFMAIGVHSQIT